MHPDLATALLLVLAAVTLLQRFAVPAAGSQLGVGFVIGVAVFAWAVATGRLLVEPVRLVLFSLVLAGIALGLAMGEGGFSPLSLAMLVLLYLPFLGVLTLSAEAYRRLLGLFSGLAMVVAASAVIQFAAQLVVGPAWMFPFDRLLPAAFFIPDFNRVITFGGGLVKSTGLWLLEPSHLSQLMAIAILVELRRDARKPVLILLGTGLLLAFSGTGLLLLAVFLPIIMLQRGRAGQLALWGAGGVLALWLLQDVFPVSVFLERLGEFANPQASGAMRFLGPWQAVQDVFAGRPDHLLFGVGPGGMADAVWHFDYAVQDSSWLKLIVEYGLAGVLPFALFYGYCLFAGSPDRLLAAALLFQVLFLGGFLLAFYVQFLVAALVVWPRLAAPAGPRRDRAASLDQTAAADAPTAPSLADFEHAQHRR